jgi:hypothetical protein
MKKIILLLGFQSVFTILYAQYSLQPMLPTKGMIQKSSLWNVLIINNSQSAISGRLELILRDRSSGLEQITATSNMVTVEKGAKQLNNTLLAPINYNFLNEGFIKQNQDLIPIGSYTACYRFTNPLGKNTSIIEECVQFDIEPLSPPMLVLPNDNAELAILPTQFSWSPPTPMGLFKQLRYDVLIVEVLPQQKPEEAIQQNVPIYLENNIGNNFINYKGSKLMFEKDKTYAWQVVAKDNNEYAAKSEVWSFKVGEEKEVKTTNQNTYVLLDKAGEKTSTVSLKTKFLYIKYYANNKNFIATLVIRKLDGTIVGTSKHSMQYGDNYFEVKLPNAIQKNSIYEATFTDFEGKIYSIPFNLL